MSLLPEPYLVLDVKPHTASGALLTVRAGERVKLHHIYRDIKASRLLARILSLPIFPTTIVNVDPSLSYMNEVAVEIIRSKPDLPITPVELETALAQVFTRVSNEQRKLAAEELDVPEIDSILVQSDARSITIDNYPVVSPIGQSGKVVRAMLTTAYTTRPVFEVWHPLFNSGRNFYFTDSARAALFALHGHRESGRVLHCGRTASYLLSRAANSQDDRLSRKKLDWGSDELQWPLMQEYGMSADVARQAVERCTSNLLSPYVSATFADLLSSANNKFYRELRATGVRSGEVHSNRPAVPGVRPARIEVKELPLCAVLSRRGLTVENAVGLSPSETLKFIAPFVEFYYHKKESPVNHWLRRRVHWLIPA